MRILTYGLSSDKLAGIETFLLNMNGNMSDDCIFDYIIEYNDEFGESNIHQKAINKKGGKVFYISPKRNIFNNFRDWRNLIKKNKEKYSTVYFNLYSMANFLPMIICKRAKMKVVLHAHNNELHNCGFLIRMLHYLGRFVTKNYGFCRLTNSSLSSRFMFGQKMPDVMIYNAISINRFSFKEKSRLLIRSNLNIMDKHVYGFVGRITYQKNPLFLIDVFDIIQKKDNNAILMIIGVGDLFNEIRERVNKKGLKDKVILLGSVDDVENYYNAMDLFLLPSRFEGLGIVLIEAQTAGLPCITSANVVPKEAKITDLLDFLPLGNPNEWAEIAINKLGQYQNTDRLKYSKDVGSSNYNIEIESKRLEKILITDMV